MAETMKLKIYPEGDGHCILHNHFDCPACGKKQASTDAYHEIEEDAGQELTCKECGASFRLIAPSAFFCDWEWAMVING